MLGMLLRYGFCVISGNRTCRHLRAETAKLMRLSRVPARLQNVAAYIAKDRLFLRRVFLRDISQLFVAPPDRLQANSCTAGMNAEFTRTGIGESSPAVGVG